MQVSGAGLGGEKSGHVIILEHTTSGDGIVTALEVLRVMAARGQPLAELAAADPAPAPAAAGGARRVTRTSGRATAPLQRAIARGPGAASGPTVASSSGRPAPNRRCGSWSRAAMPPLVAELADAIASLAGERLN